MEALLGLIALIVVALVGWAIAEFKYKAFTFTRSAKDIEEEEELEDVDEDADTIAGLLLNLKGDFLKEKEQMACGRCRFTVLSVLKHRIATVRVKILPRREDEK